MVSLSTPLATSLRLGRRSMAPLVRVEDQQRWVFLTRRPPIGATLDVGFPVLVTESREVASGGLLITAERIHEDSGS